MQDDKILEFGKVAVSNLDAVSSRLQNNILEAYNVEAVRMFARLHATDETTGAFNREEYNNYIRNYESENEYNRFSFKNKREAENFASQLRSQSSNNNVVVAPVSLNGKYLVETKGAVEMQTENGSVQQVTNANQISQIYEQQTNYQAKVYSVADNYKPAYENKQIGEAESGMLTSLIDNEQDKDVRKLQRKFRRLQQELDGYTSRNDNNALLHSDTKRDIKTGKEVFDENTGTGVKPQRRKDKSIDHQATVVNFLNNRMVIVDGKLVTDFDEVQKIQNLHSERMDFIDNAKSRMENTNAVVGRVFFGDENSITDRKDHKFLFSREQIKMQINAEGVRQRRIRQNYYSHTTFSNYDSTPLDSFRNNLGKEQILMSNLNTDILIDKCSLDAINNYKNSDDYGKRIFTDSKFAKFSKREEETLNKINHLFYIKKDATSVLNLSAEDRINLNSMAKKTINYGESYIKHGASSPPVALNVLDNLRSVQEHTNIKAVDSDISQALDFVSYNQVVNLYNDLGIDLRFKEINGNALTSQQLLLGTDSRVLRFLQTKGVLYDGEIGKFVDKTGKALNKAELENVFKTVNTESNLVAGVREIGNQIINNADIDAKLFENISNAFNTNDIENFFGDEKGLDKALASTNIGQEHGKSAMAFFEKSGEQYGFKITDDGKIIHHREKPDITRYDVLQIDKGFLLKMATPVVDKNNIKHDGIMLVKFGKIDIKAIKKLSKEELSVRGISESTRDLIVKLHTDKNGKYVEWDKFKGVDVQKLANRMAQLTDDDKEVAEIMNMISFSSDAVKTSKEVMKVAKQFKESAKISVDYFKMKLEDKGIKVPENPIKKLQKPKEKKEPVKTNKNIAKSGDVKKIEKRIAKEQKQIAKIERSERRLTFLKKFDIKERIKEKFAETKLGQLLVKGKYLARGLAVKAIVIFGQVYLILTGFLIIAVICLSVIENFTGLPKKGLMALVDLLTEQDIAMVELYDYLDKRQTEWIKATDNPKELYYRKEGLNYSLNYTEYEDYINSREGFVLLNNKLYIDPYYQLGTSDADVELRKNHLMEVDGFFGNNKYSLVANPSLYTAISTDENNIISAESGHTSNIKDILAMTDVMYGYNMIECSDGELQSALSCEPAKIDANAYYNYGVQAVSWAVNLVENLGKGLWKLFITGFEDTTGFADIQLLPDWEEELTYDTILNYVSFLWDSSHQNQFDINIDNYYPKAIKLNGTELNDLEREQASLLETNINKREDKFDIIAQQEEGSANVVIRPCIEDAEGNKIFVNSTGVLLNNVRPVNENNWCLFFKKYNADGSEYRMGSNEGTYNFIKDNAENGSECWERVTPDDTINHQLSATSDWKYNEEDAIEDAKDKIQGLINENLAKAEYQKRYLMNGDNFTYTYYEDNFASRNLSNFSIANDTQKVATFDLPTSFWNEEYSAFYDRQDWKEWLTRTDGNAFDFYEYNYDENTGEWVDWKERTFPLAPAGTIYIKLNLRNPNDNSQKKKETVTRYASYGYKPNGEPWFDYEFGDFTERGIEYWSYIDDNNGEWTNLEVSGWEVESVDSVTIKYTDDHEYQDIYRKIYQATATVDDAIREVSENYVRDCKGDGYDEEGNEYTNEKHHHKYSFNAPEVSINSKGIVYSITNEQLAMSGVYNSNLEIPKALDFNLTEQGYSQMQGHHIGQDNGKINYDTARTAVDTSYCELPSATNPQGSITGNYGLNLILDGDSWKSAGLFGEAIVPKSDISTYLLKDIFDIDCLLNKASNVFCHELPQYEGWSADNKTVATLKTSIDWNDVYEMDIPLEVGCATLAPEDIEWLNNALEIQYGDAYSGEKQEVMNLLFKWVGRGHYSDEHNEHDFLTSACGNVSSEIRINGTVQTEKFQVSCTAGDSVGFANFIRNAFEKSTFTRNESNSDALLKNIGYQNLTPCDIIHQVPNLDLDDVLTLPDGTYAIDYSSLTKVDKNVNCFSNLMKEVCAFYVGCFTNDEIFADCPDGKKVLLNGFVIEKGVPVTIGMDNLVKKTNDVNEGSGCGTVFLRSQTIPDMNVINNWSNTTNYFWLLNPNDETYYRCW